MVTGERAESPVRHHLVFQYRQRVCQGDSSCALGHQNKGRDHEKYSVRDLDHTRSNSVARPTRGLHCP